MAGLIEKSTRLNITWLVGLPPDGGSITVSVQRKDDDLVISVKDNGIGISSADQARIFQPFERLGTSRGIAGAGLGLSVCHRLVEAHGGRL